VELRLALAASSLIQQRPWAQRAAATAAILASTIGVCAAPRPRRRHAMFGLEGAPPQSPSRYLVGIGLGVRGRRSAAAVSITGVSQAAVSVVALLELLDF
jgi:hypothetical protein